MSEQRRRLLQSLIAGSGSVVVAKSLPSNWVKPVVDSVMLPAHARTSGEPESSVSKIFWIPACAGMTRNGFQLSLQ